MPSGVPYTHVNERKTMEWTDGEPGPRTSKFVRIFELVKHAQAKHPGKWATIESYESQQVAADTATRLRKRYGEEFEIKASKHPDGSERGIVRARARDNTNG